jgi:hypothetical protein
MNYITSGRKAFQTIAATLFVLAAPVATHASVAASGIGTGSGRTGAIVAGVVGLISVVIGRLALSRRIGSGRTGAIIAIVAGLTGIILGVLHLARSSGGFGTGNGRAGAIVAIVVGLIGMILGRLALARSRRIATGNSSAATTSPRERT